MTRRAPRSHIQWPAASLWLAEYTFLALLLCAAAGWLNAVRVFKLLPLLVLILAGLAAAAALHYKRPVSLAMVLIIGLATGWLSWLGGSDLAGALGAGLAALLVMFASLAFLLRQVAAVPGKIEHDRLRDFIQQSGEGICLTDEQGIVIEWNRAYESLTGIPRAEVLGQPIWGVIQQLTPPGANSETVTQQAQTRMADFLATGNPIPQHEVPIRSRSGETRYLLITEFFIHTGQGTLGCSTARDVTGYRLAEQALRESERILHEANDRFRMLFENSPDGIILTDYESRIIVDCNDNAAHMNGYTREEMINRPVDELHEPGYYASFTPEELAGYEAILEKGTLRTEIVHTRKDGSRFTIESAMCMVHKDGRKILLGIDRDITERKQMEAALHASEALFKDLFNQAPIGVTTYDANGRLVKVNPACLAIFGVTDAASTDGFSLFDDPNLPNEVKDELRQGKKVRCELEFDFGLVREHDLYATDKSGKRWLDVVASPLFGDQGINGYIVQMMDITERKRSQQSEHELRLLAEALVDGASVLNSTLMLDEVLDHILTSIAQILPHDALLVMLIEEGLGQVVSQRNLLDPSVDQAVRQVAVPLSSAPLLEQVYQSRHWLISSDDALIHSWLCRQPEFRWVRSIMIAPLMSRNEVTGILALFSAQPTFFTEMHAQRLQAFAGQAAIAIANARLYNEVHNLATHDELTGLLNRRAIISMGRREIERCRRFKRPLAVLFIDIDLFKQFNDRYSYEVGDQVLCFIARQLRGSVREVDMTARYGGEEFVAILTECGLPEAIEVAERLRRKIETTRAFTEMGELGVTISIGLAQIRLAPGLTGQLTGSDQKTLEELFQRAGQALQTAKRNGRNRVEVAPDLPNLRP